VGFVKVDDDSMLNSDALLRMECNDIAMIEYECGGGGESGGVVGVISCCWQQSFRCCGLTIVRRQAFDVTQFSLYVSL
jgi:hypothetical protein